MGDNADCGDVLKEEEELGIVGQSAEADDCFEERAVPRERADDRVPKCVPTSLQLATRAAIPRLVPKTAAVVDSDSWVVASGGRLEWGDRHLRRGSSDFQRLW